VVDVSRETGRLRIRKKPASAWDSPAPPPKGMGLTASGIRLRGGVNILNDEPTPQHDASSASRPDGGLWRRGMCAPSGIRLRGEDHDAAIAFFSLRFAAKACFRHRVVDDLPFKRVHRFELHGLT
jgi:hypothetical protein